MEPSHPPAPLSQAVSSYQLEAAQAGTITLRGHRWVRMMMQITKVKKEIAHLQERASKHRMIECIKPSTQKKKKKKSSGETRFIPCFKASRTGAKVHPGVPKIKLKKKRTGHRFLSLVFHKMVFRSEYKGVCAQRELLLNFRLTST